MKLFKQGTFAIAMLFAMFGASAQPGNFIPELVFRNPTLITAPATAGQDGAIYKFSDVATGIDATVTITARSSASVVLDNIDESDLGWGKAFQPKLGIAGNVPANQNWWMEFEMDFYDAGTNNRKKIKGFQVTAIDMDGDGASIQEYLQMNRVQSVSYSPVSYLIENTAMAVVNQYTGSGYNKSGLDKLVQGPVQNFSDIDTSGTGVMATFTYQDKDMIVFRYGGKSGATVSNAGERLNSLWFKAFSLTPQQTLPVTFHNWIAMFDKQNVTLSWTVDTDETFGDYRVERSTDGKSFSEIGIVFTSPNIDVTNNYQFKDMNVSSSTGILYYRLHWLLRSKESAYSPVKAVRLAKDQGGLVLTTYPNPVMDQLWVSLPSSWQGKAVQLELFNGNGARTQNQQIGSASQTENIKLNNLPSGFYLVKATCNGETAEQRIIKY